MRRGFGVFLVNPAHGFLRRHQGLIDQFGACRCLARARKTAHGLRCHAHMVEQLRQRILRMHLIFGDGPP